MRTTLLLATLPGLLFARVIAQDEVDPAMPQATRQAVAAFRGARFGMFIHWGPVSLEGAEIGSSRGRDVSTDEYDRLDREFLTQGFDANEWAGIAAEAGMRYLVITAKHHDGFCLWPSEYTDYDIASTPFGRDVVRELSDACKRHGMRFCTYYSICDWYHPDYPLGSPGGRTKKSDPNMPRYYQYVADQTRELVEEYGPLGIMWFDGHWEAPWTLEHGDRLYRSLKRQQPGLIINNRVGKRRHGEGQPGIVGDYDTPEQRIGSFDRDRPWETCMTLCRQWAWKPGDRLKSLADCLGILIRTVGGDGNLLLNVGPMPDGRIEPRQVARLKEIGAWLERFGDGVHGTRGGPFKPGPWGASTCKGNRIWLFVLRWPKRGPLVLPAIAKKVVGSRALSGGQATIDSAGDGLTLSMAEAGRDPIATVVELTLDGAAFDVGPVDVHLAGKPLPTRSATASNVFRSQAGFAAEKAVDGDRATRWATDAGTGSAWLEIDLGAPRELGAALVHEAYAGRVQSYQLQAWTGESWTTLHSGTTLGEHAELEFAPVTTTRVRLSVTKATEGPTIWEFLLFAPRRS